MGQGRPAMQHRAASAPLRDRRLAPRPLPAHLRCAAGLWLSSQIALPCLRSGLLPSSKAASRAADRLRALAAEIDAFGRDQVAAALDTRSSATADYLAGLEAYRHPYRRPEMAAPVIWREGATQLLDGRDDAAPSCSP